MKCASCGTEKFDEREPLLGFAQIRCHCGVRRAPRIRAVQLSLTTKRGVIRGGNGYIKAGVFYGVCKAPLCGQSFTATHPRQTCNAAPCRRWAKTRNEQMVARVCGCGAPYVTSNATQDYCSHTCRERAKNTRYADARRARRLKRAPALSLDCYPKRSTIRALDTASHNASTPSAGSTFSKPLSDNATCISS